MNNSESTLRAPSANRETEQALISALLIDNSVYSECTELKPEYFYNHAHQKIYRAMAFLFHRNEPVDLVTVATTLQAFGELEQVGGAAYLSEIADSAPIATNAWAYAKIIMDCAMRRQLQADAARLLDGASNGVDAEALLKQLNEIQKTCSTKVHQNKAKFQLKRLSEIEFKKPDWLIKPLFEKDTLAMVFSDPGGRKTFLAIDIACSVATGKNFHGMKVSQGLVIYIAGEGQVLWPSTYSSISNKLDLMAQNYDKIILDINSPGGLVAGVFDLSDKIYSMRSKVRLYAFANESCYSAAYCIASACHKVFIARSAGVGSVGVITTHVDQSVLNDRVGLNITRIYAGSKKNDFSPHSPLSPRAMEDLQKAIDADYEIFCSTVGRNRGMLAASVKATEAGIFHGQDAVDIGFVDSIKSEIEAFKEISTGSPSPTLAKAIVSDSSELLIENAKARAAALQTEQAKRVSNTTPQIINRTSYLH